MKGKKSIAIILLVGLLLVGIMPAEVIYAGCGCGGGNTNPKPPVVTEPEEPKDPVVVEPAPKPELPKETYEDPNSSEGTSIDNVKNEEKAKNEEKPKAEVVKKPEVKVEDLTIAFTVGESTYVKNDEEVEMDGTPFISNDRIMVPLRYVAEALQMEVEYDEETQIATFANETTTIKIHVINGEMTINDEVYEGDTPPQLVEGRTYISLGSLAESLGMTRETPESGNDLSWNQEEMTATITKKVK